LIDFHGLLEGRETGLPSFRAFHKPLVGFPLEHNFGQDKQHLAQLFVLLNLLAFTFHTVCDSVEKLWQEARAVLVRWLRKFGQGDKWEGCSSSA